MSVRESLYESEPLTRIYIEGARDPKALSGEELVRFRLLCHNMLPSRNGASSRRRALQAFQKRPGAHRFRCSLAFSRRKAGSGSGPATPTSSKRAFGMRLLEFSRTRSRAAPPPDMAL